ncbi:MAG: 5'/3'-nucleotidase SurE [Candidatus Methanofastidiosa archaeon]|nr:5'/3'-nucleotidase SurE [Candidatus Methanofastidiosa archaeon]
MRILVTNDDGYGREGIKKLTEVAESLGEVVVIAPKENCSGIGHSYSIFKKIGVEEIYLEDKNRKDYIVSGTPVDCVALAVRHYMREKIDLILSGINHGENISYDIYYSGTVAAAREGIINGIPSISVSSSDYFNPMFDTATKFLNILFDSWNFKKFPTDTLLNINVPSIPFEELKGVEITRLGRRVYYEEPFETDKKDGKMYFKVFGKAPSGYVEEGTDYSAIKNNKISLTPIHLDATNHNEMNSWKEVVNIDTIKNIFNQ